MGCDGTVLGHTGWYSELHFDPLQAVELDPAITDVQVARPPSVLHVGTGLPRMMIVTVDSCDGPPSLRGRRLVVPPGPGRGPHAPNRR